MQKYADFLVFSLFDSVLHNFWANKCSFHDNSAKNRTKRINKTHPSSLTPRPPEKTRAGSLACMGFIWIYGMSRVPFFSFLLLFKRFEWHLEKTYYFIGCFIRHVTIVLSFSVSHWKEILRLPGIWCSVIYPTFLLKISQCASTLIFAKICHQFTRTCTLMYSGFQICTSFDENLNFTAL